MPSKWWFQDCNVSLFDSKTCYFNHIFFHGKTGMKELLGQSHNDAVRIRISLTEKCLFHPFSLIEIYFSCASHVWTSLFNLMELGRENLLGNSKNTVLHNLE